MSEEGMLLLTWSGREKETGAELLSQALEHLLEGGGRTDRHTDTEQDEGVSPLSITTIIYPTPPPTLPRYGPSLAMTLGTALTMSPGTPGRQKFLFAA